MSEKPARLHSTCPICSSHKLAFRWQVNGYSIVRCQDCTLVFVKERPTPQELTAFYSKANDMAYQDNNLECLNFYYQTLRKLIEERHPAPGRLLDVGCSGGWFLDTMQSWDCYGSEINPTDAETAHQKHGDHIFEGFFEDYPNKPGFFDVITLQDVFDHFAEPVAALEKCYLLLKPGGLIVIKVHNISCWYAKLTGSGFYAIIPPGHLFYYDKNTLYRVLKDTGFQATGAKYLAHILKLKTIFFRLSQGSMASPFYRVYSILSKSRIGEIRIRKNLHDIITVFAIKT